MENPQAGETRVRRGNAHQKLDSVAKQVVVEPVHESNYHVLSVLEENLSNSVVLGLRENVFNCVQHGFGDSVKTALCEFGIAHFLPIVGVNVEFGCLELIEDRMFVDVELFQVFTVVEQK
ncbi:hypothetical protein OGAPHI_002143 [Ogataea philodendri]|uniref:Uncharacterized protein n=1 Tax=Ogataea philodendri TaxID=1378263 RepID=A0A9P8T7E5_9ASCO|nr:uncharacterized protein OGAPHI_002143 [Ogataea philodendri]KAH3668389.1 hypothetical protein OGAPHI_002143 [Ogataea philodendri]